MHHDAALRTLIACATVFQIADGVTIEACRQRDGANLWAVRSYGNVLNKRLTWEYEPLPSRRTDAFLRRTRFVTIADALAAVKALAHRGEISLTCALP